MAAKHNVKFLDTDFYMTVEILNILFMEEYTVIVKAPFTKINMLNNTLKKYIYIYVMVFNYKYLNVLKSRYIYLRCKMTLNSLVFWKKICHLSIFFLFLVKLS